MCVDLRKLNEVIKHDSYQSPRNDDALAWLATKISSLKTTGLGARAHRLKDHNVCGVVRVRGRIATIVARRPQAS